jgi:hypothetical protein
MPRKKQETENKVISHGTAKVFRYNAGIDALVDGNTVQMAFLARWNVWPKIER